MEAYENMFTTPMQKVVAIAASTAFPPSFRMSIPIIEHRLFSEATAPFLARTRYDGFLCGRESVDGVRDEPGLR